MGGGSGHQMRKTSSVSIAIFLLLSGCASAQLNFNTLEIASTVESLQTKQVLYNISKFIDDTDAVPDQVEINGGTVSTTNSVTPSITSTLTSASVVAAAASTTKTAANSLQAPLSDQWTQAWSIVPVTDGDDLRRLRALYGFAAQNDIDILMRYPEIYYIPQARSPKAVPDPFFLSKNHLVINKKTQQPGPTLCRDWIYYSGPSRITGLERLPPAGMPVVNLGLYGSHELYMAVDDKLKGCLSNFVLLVLDAAGETSSPYASAAGKVTVKGGASPAIVISPQAPIVTPPAPP